MFRKISSKCLQIWSSISAAHKQSSYSTITDHLKWRTPIQAYNQLNSKLSTVDLEIFVQRNFHMINIRVKIFFAGTTPYCISVNSAR